MPFGAKAIRAPGSAEVCIGIALKKRWFHGNGLWKLFNTQPSVLSNMHLFGKRSEGGQLPRQGQQYPVANWLRPGAALLNLWYRGLCSGSKGNMRFDMAVHAWGHMMHEQDACDLVLPFWDLDTAAGAMQQWHMCLDTTVLVWGRKLREQDAGVLVVLNAARPEREDSKDSHWRQPLTSDAQAFVPEVTILHHPIGRATDIRTRQEWVITGLSKSAPNILSCGQICPATHDQRSFPDFAPGLPGLYLA